jgi:hypothetical protein
LLAAACLVLAGCTVVSTHPLSTPASSTIDRRLEGAFVGSHDQPDGDLSVLHLHYARKEGPPGKPAGVTPWLELLLLQHDPKDGLHGLAARALTVHLGRHDYMSFAPTGTFPASGRSPASLYPSLAWLAGLPKGYLLFRYEIGAFGQLRLWLADSTAMADAVKTGKLKGRIVHHTLQTGLKPGQGFDLYDVILTDSTDHLAAFIAAGDPKALFSGSPLVVQRLAR